MAEALPIRRDLPHVYLEDELSRIHKQCHDGVSEWRQFVQLDRLDFCAFLGMIEPRAKLHILISLDVGRFLLPLVLHRLKPEDLFDLLDEWAGARGRLAAIRSHCEVRGLWVTVPNKRRSPSWT
jgi:hypothetical protein